MKVFDIESELKSFKNVHLESYIKPGLPLTIGLKSETDELIVLLTINLDYSTSLGENMAFVDVFSASWAEDFIKVNSLGVPLGVKVRSKQAVYPLYKFNLDKLKEFTD